MEGLRQYVITVVAAALLCGVISDLFRQNGAHGIIKLVCGLFLAYTALAPLAGLHLEDWTDGTLPYAWEGVQAAAMGENLSKEARETIIKEEIQTYILDKAAALGAELTAEVTLDEENLPTQVTVQGATSPYVRRQLERIFILDLGIAKENQQWIG